MANSVGTARAGQEPIVPKANLTVVATRPKPPTSLSRRPPEPVRPIPAHKVGDVSVLAVKLRRRRYSDALGRLGNW